MKKIFKMKWFFAVLLTMVFACAPNPKRIENAELQYKIGKKFYFNGNKAQAIASLRGAVKEDPRNPEIQHFLGLVYFENGVLNDAEKHLKNSVRLKKDYGEAHNHLCALYNAKKNYKQALLSCDRAINIALYATPERAHYNKALIYQKINKAESAKKSFKKALAINPKFVPSLSQVAKMSLEKGEFEDAEQKLTQIVEICKNPQSAWGVICQESQHDLAGLYVKLRRSEQAKTLLRSCISDSSKETAIHQKCVQRYAEMRSK